MQPFQKAWTLLKGTEDWHHNAAHSLNLMLGGYDNDAKGEMGYEMLDKLHAAALKARGIPEEKIQQQLDNQHFFADDRDYDLWSRVMQPLSMHIGNMYRNMVSTPERATPMIQEWDRNAAELRAEQKEKLSAQEQFKQFMAGEEQTQPEPNTNYPIEQRLGVDSSGYPLD